MSTQPLKIKENSNHHNRLPIETRPEWTRVELGRNFTITACVIAGRILITRTCGFVTTDDADQYCNFIQSVINDGLVPGQPYSYVMEWSDFKGGSVGARWQVWGFIQSQTNLQSLLFCSASPLMRMSVKLTQRVAPAPTDILFCQDLDQGIHLAGKNLGLRLPDYFDLPDIFLERIDRKPVLGDQLALITDLPPQNGPATYQHELSSGQTVVFKRIGPSILFCYFSGRSLKKKIVTADILKARRQAISTCLPGQSTHIEIWDCTNLDAYFNRAAMRKLIRALFDDSLPLVGCFFLDIGCKVRSLVRWCLWRHRPPYPVHCLASLTMAILQAHEQLQAAGYYKTPPPPKRITKPEWDFGDSVYSIKNEIVDHDTIHTIGGGYMQIHHLREVFAIQRQMALEIISAGHAYYIIGGIEALHGGSYKARKRFLAATRKLYKDFPFRMYLFYGAKGKVQAAINLAKHAVPYRMVLADDFEHALSIVRADKTRRAYLDTPPPIKEQVWPPAALAALQPAVDSILRHLSTVSWDPDSRIRPKPAIPANHPCAQILDAIDLINDDLKSVYQERQKAAFKQTQLQQQLARSRKMEALGLLAGGVAHDLNNVLSGIVAYPDVLLMELSKDSTMRKALKAIRTSGEKAAAIVQDLLTMSRRGLNIATPLNINDLIDDYLKSLEHDAITRRYPGITIDVQLKDDLKPINASPVHIKQTIMNLILNAIEATEQSGTITIATENRSVHSPFKGYETIPAGEYTSLQVKDQGIGIAQKDLEHIFEPFYTKKKMGRSGTGLGMAIVWGTMQDSSGYIDINSTVGQGTLFTLYFPVTDKAIPADMEMEPLVSCTGNGESILIVDDELEQREIATAILSRIGYRVSVADSGGRAIAILDKQSVDLVIVDMIMETGMDGLETITKIKHLHPDQKTMICTGYAEDNRVKEAQAQCDGPLVQKPYSMQTIGKAVYRTLNDDSLRIHQKYV